MRRVIAVWHGSIRRIYQQGLDGTICTERTPATQMAPTRAPDDFVCGVVLHAGERAYRLGDRLPARPMPRL